MLTIALMIVSQSSLKAQQDAMFVQTFFDQTFINPGAAGGDTVGYFNATAMNRNQITGFEGAPVTTMINVNGALNIGASSNNGVSLTLYNDKFGFISTPAFNLGYAYRIELGKGSLGMGLSVGLLFSTIDSEGWRTPDGGNDPAIPTSKGAKQSFDAGAGLFYCTDKFFAGLSCTHLTNPVFVAGDEKTRLKRNFYVSGGYRFAMPNPDINLRTSALILTDLAQTQFGVNATLFFRNNKYWAGIDYRLQSAVSLLAGMNLLPNLKIGYSYGYNTSELSKFSGGNHEIMLKYRFAVFIERGKQKYKSIRYL
jgi:type IX secretion system PorP/SprF family membrane protein